MAAELLPGFHWLGHASFRIEAQKLVVYFDPWQLRGNQPKADLIFITHDHHDHCSPEDVLRLLKPDTVVVAPEDCLAALQPLGAQVQVVRVGDRLTLKGVSVEVVPAYNLGKHFHPQEPANVGYIITLGDMRVYHAGDTDLIPEMAQIKADIALLPVGGTYTMDAKEAAQAVARIRPRIAVPMHYGRIVGDVDDAHRFAQLVQDSEVAILPEE